uniref:Uncharacterized protein n=1 Tax=Anopheles christyi TaxID=43041 RepID=A0A182K3B0_9DIPT
MVALTWVLLSAALVLAGVTVRWFLGRRQTFWQRHGIPAAGKPHLLYGNTAGLVTKHHTATILQHLYREFRERQLPAGGFNLFFSPMLLVVDRQLIERVLVKDFAQFENRGLYATAKVNPLSSETLFAVAGKRWHRMRNQLRPAFASNSVRTMFATTVRIAQTLVVYVGAQGWRRDLEWTDLMARYTTDVIGSCAFGIDCRTIRDPGTQFRAMGYRAFRCSLRRMWKLRFGYAFRRIADVLRLCVSEPSVEQFFLQLCQSTVLHRESYQVVRRDFLQLLLELKANGVLDMREVAGQCYSFFLAGFETSASLLNFCLYELAKSGSVQERLRATIVAALEETDGQLSYDMVMTLEYLDQVVNETLRMYPPVDFLFRVANNDYPIDGFGTIPQGTLLVVPVHALHRDPTYYPQPDVYDPDRFASGSRSKGASKTRPPFLPFGLGPRHCIGDTFGLMLVKVGLVAMLRSFRFSLDVARTPENVSFKPRSLVLAPASGMYLNVERQTMELLTVILSLLFIIATGLYLFVRNRYNYWTNRGFPTLPNQKLLFGHVKGINTERHASYVSSDIYREFKQRGEAFGGFNMFIIPAVMLVEPEIVKTILVKDFHIFHDRGLFSDAEVDPLSGTLFALQGKAWKILRQKLTPTFTSGKMKQMFGTIREVGERLGQYVADHADAGPMEMKDVLARYTTDVIGTCAFGIECNTLKNPNSDFLKYGNKVFEQNVSTMIKIILVMMGRKISSKFTLKITDDDVESFFMKLVRETVEYREANNVKRNDFMNLLLQIKNTGALWEGEEEHIGKGEVGMTMNELAAQVFIFFLAGFETSSTTMNFCLYELAKNQDLQERLRREVNQAVEENGGQITYDVVMGIEYLNKVVDETLRKYPPLETITRAPEHDYTVPGTGHVIPKGTMVQIPIYALHHDPEYYPEPERFDPERFRPEVVSARPPYVYMPFGEGPRICIGLRFGMMQTKVGLITLLRQFRFSTTDKTPDCIRFMPKMFVLSPDTIRVTMSLLGALLLGVVLLLSLVYLFLRNRHAYWCTRGFPCKPNPSLLFGQMQGNGTTRHAAYVTQEIYQYAKERGERFIGYSFFFMPLVLVCDIELVKTVLVKDFAAFHDRGMYSNPRVDPLSGNLFSLEGHEWRTLRQKLTPTFTAGRMRQMFGTMVQVAKELQRHLLNHHVLDRELEMKEVLARFTTDVIGTCAFGIECNTLQDPNSDFLKYGRRVFEHRLPAMLKVTFAMLCREWAKKLGVKVTDDDLEAFFMNLVHETVEYREKNKVQTNDFLNLLLEIKNKGCLETEEQEQVGAATVMDGQSGMTMSELAAQVFIFFVAGFETSSTVMNFALYELARNQDIQERLRDELNRAIEESGGELTYETVMNHAYLGQVVNETLRKYPPLETTLRVTAQDYTIPGTTHIIPGDVRVQIPVYAIHHDPDHYPDPERFDPMRFTAEQCKKRTPYTFLPFGEGPRICIGMRFGMMQVKVGLASLLRTFRFHPTTQTPERILFDPKTFILSPAGGNYLRIAKVLVCASIRESSKMDLLSYVLTAFVFVISIAYLYLRSRHNYWRDRSFPYTRQKPHLLYGHMEHFQTRHASYINEDLYREFKSRGEPIGGMSMFFLPGLIVADADLVKAILVKDFSVFHDRGVFNDAKADPLSAHLFALEGHEWRVLRQKLTPTFTSGRMKQMFGTIQQVAGEFLKFMNENCHREIEMKDVLARFTTDVIGTCAFGIECNTLKNPDSDFRKYGNKVFEQDTLLMLKFMFATTFKSLAKRIGMKLTDDGVERFFLQVVRETVEYREMNNVQRNDFMNLLLQIKNKGSLDGGEEPIKGAAGLTMNELAAQVFVFFLAGFETSSTTMNFCLYELAKNQDVQDRLREEIERAIEENGGEVTYELVMNVQYLDNVINETLRKYPPIESLSRVPMRDYTVPGTKHVIPKDTFIQIPVYALHRDPEFYPEPEQFNPDRFLPEQVKERHPYVFLPFGEGPRICIGLRFGVMQAKIGLITLLRNFRFTPSSQTPAKIVFDPKSFILSPSTVSSVYLFVRSKHNFWKDQGVPYAPKPHFFYGHVKGQSRTRHGADINQELYRAFKQRGVPYGGISLFIMPSLIVVDPELVKTILVKDFNVFHDRGVYSNPRDDPLTGNLFGLEGTPWRLLRQKLTPTFTSGRMKQMFGTIWAVALELEKYMEANYNQPEVEMKDVLGRFTTDVIGTCAFGIECNTLKTPDSEFRKYGNKAFELDPVTMIKFFFATSYPQLARKLHVRTTQQDVEDFFMKIVRETVDYREGNNVQRNDFMNLLLQIKNKGKLDDHGTVVGKGEVGLTHNELAAQVLIFFLAGFETSSTTQSFCLYELAKNQDIQDRLREEINRAVEENGGEV